MLAGTGVEVGKSVGVAVGVRVAVGVQVRVLVGARVGDIVAVGVGDEGSNVEVAVGPVGGTVPRGEPQPTAKRANTSSALSSFS